MKHVLVLIGFVFLLFSCDNEEAWDCVQKQGNIVRVEIPMDSVIRQLKVFDDIKTVLHSSDSQRIVLETGENLINEIEFLLDTGVLHVFNHNGCRWTKPSENVVLHIYSSQLNFFEKYGYGDIVSEDSIRHWIRFKTYNPGRINLILSNASISFELYSLTNITLSGKTQSLGAYIGTARDPRVDASELAAQKASITNNGFNDIIVNPIETLNYRIWSSGNIIVVNEPINLNEVEVTGTGRLIKKY